MTHGRKKWRARFPRLINFLGCQFGQDFSLYGTTIDQLTHDFVSRAGLGGATQVISEMKQLIALMKAGDIDPDKFMEEIKEETIPKYDHLSMLEYFEAIRDSLEKNRQEIYGNDV